ncbi:hypothetical protein [Treponema sp. J25]|jgi:hypothetical protein|uniref:hypothetical protein n=1 Tax=Treponema sp. J25 TaxID=2094121 RepID=UPI00104ACD25|nr:hypothetical protein [Treponema sp. J25]TCW60399.1 hypothetical protein C5O22_11725 [Treponema sp. J25]
MNTKELKMILERENYDPHSYSLDGMNQWECYCLEKSYGAFHVFYNERGNRVGEKTFKSEDEACRYLYEKLKSDPTTKKKRDN